MPPAATQGRGVPNRPLRKDTAAPDHLHRFAYYPGRCSQRAASGAENENLVTLFRDRHSSPHAGCVAYVVHQLAKKFASSQAMVASGRMDPQPACGTKFCWQVSSCLTLVLGIAMLAICVVVGGCECKNVCEAQQKGSCANYFDGCNTDYSAQKCAQNLIRGGSCSHSDCSNGAMTPAGWFACALIGIVSLILSCVSCCGCAMVCCFAPSVDPSTPVVEVQPVAPTETA